jgi:hypothetical protein
VIAALPALLEERRGAHRGELPGDGRRDERIQADPLCLGQPLGGGLGRGQAASARGRPLSADHRIDELARGVAVLDDRLRRRALADREMKLGAVLPQDAFRRRIPRFTNGS